MSFRGIHRESADRTAIGTGEKPFLDPEAAKSRVGSATRPLHVGTAAGVAAEAAVLSAFQLAQFALKHPRPVFCIFKSRVALRMFRLKLRVAGFCLRQLGFDEVKALFHERRRAVLVNEALQRREQLVKQAHGQFLSGG